MSISNKPLFYVKQQAGNCITLNGSAGQVAHVLVLEPDIVRIVVLPDGTMQFPRTWAIAPGAEDVPEDGRDRFDLSGFALPSFVLHLGRHELQVTTASIRLTIQLEGLYCQWESQIDGQWRYAASDRYTQAYNFGWWDQRVYHYLQRDSDEMYFGLGERSGETNRAGQRYRMTNLDAMGYNARTSDPLYKHVPFYLTWKPVGKVPFGLFYDTLADCTFDLGRELDNYHGLYRTFIAEHGDLDYYFIAGATIAEVVRRYTWLTGRPAFMPRWSLGYSGSAMAYTEAPNAQERMNEFLDHCLTHDIPCTSFHLSSGYTTRGDKRYVFCWDTAKFPHAQSFVKHYIAHGVRLCANIKPCLLPDHPAFAELRKGGRFVRAADGEPLLTQFWGEPGAYLDFTHPDAAGWWKAGVTESLLKLGVTATWNDNNEFEIWDDQATIHGFGTTRRAVEAKPLQTLLMMRASRDAQREFASDMRPFLISRSGTVGMQRYVQTWSGDNYTSWETLRYNIKMGVGLALSGISNTGHDIGGFSGPRPDPELFLRWVQFGIFLPRFSIHSWNDDRTVNEPWMHASIVNHIRALIQFRGQLTPYLYNLLWRSHSRYEPMIRPTFHDFPDDERCFEESDEMMLGDALLVAAVVHPGQTDRAIYLPRGCGWYDFWSGQHHEGGHTVRLAAPWDRPLLLAREGCAIPLNRAEQHFGVTEDRRGFAIFPIKGPGDFITECFEDDGESEAYRQGMHGTWRLTVESTPTEVLIRAERLGQQPPSDTRIELLLPESEVRRVILSGATSHGGPHSRRKAASPGRTALT